MTDATCPSCNGIVDLTGCVKGELIACEICGATLELVGKASDLSVKLINDEDKHSADEEF